MLPFGSAEAISVAPDASFFSAPALIALLALTLMEIVLGIDNIVFIAILTGKLPPEKRSLTRRVGLLLAMGMRIALLMAIGWLMSLTSTLFEFSSLLPNTEWTRQLLEEAEINEVSWRDLILLGGGLFLMFTAVREIHHKIEGESDEHAEGDGTPKTKTVGAVLFQIAIMDVIFSLDSVITAVGMASQISIMVAAVIISIIVMMIFANQISDFVQEHPTVKMLALSFLILIAVVLVSESIGTPINKGYVYFAMAFSLMVEFLNLRMTKKRATRSGVAGQAA
ncbi:MAG: TerC family protein [Planctomycetota bacterium]